MNKRKKEKTWNGQAKGQNKRTDRKTNPTGNC